MTESEKRAFIKFYKLPMYKKVEFVTGKSFIDGESFYYAYHYTYIVKCGSGNCFQ